MLLEVLSRKVCTVEGNLDLASLDNRPVSLLLLAELEQAAV